jgi:hypothetical protein
VTRTQRRGHLRREQAALVRGWRAGHVTDGEMAERAVGLLVRLRRLERPDR